MKKLLANLRSWIWKVTGGTIPVVSASQLENDGSVEWPAEMYSEDKEA